MIVAVPKEIKSEEYRVAMTPEGVSELTAAGHRVLVEPGAGEGSGFADDAYASSGAELLPRTELFRKAELIVKVKEPLPSEFPLFRSGQALFTYLHLAPNLVLTEFLITTGITALAYETLEVDGALPLLAPMSEIAGRMAPLAGGWALQKVNGGRGLLPTGAVGVAPARALILGAGTVGYNAARVACGMGMETVVLNRGAERLQQLDRLFPGRIRTGALTAATVREELRSADMVIGALLVPGGRTPLLIKREMLSIMLPGAVIVDVAVDQGGCAETTHPTTHAAPAYLVDGIVHYAVANMPGAYPRSSTIALTNATLPWVRLLAGHGIDAAIESDPAVATSLNIRDGRVVHPVLAREFA
jgi:alanine dehydrogenase